MSTSLTLLLVALAGAVVPSLAAPQNYLAPIQTYNSPCDDGYVRKADGSCARPVITRNLFLYNAPTPKITYGPAPDVPDPKVHYNFVFVRTPEAQVGPRPLVVTPPQQKTLVYLLNKRPDVQPQEVIEFPANPTQPEVYFINYRDGDNPELPGGIDLQTALSQSAAAGQVIGDFSSSEVGGGSVEVGGGGAGYDVRVQTDGGRYN